MDNEGIPLLIKQEKQYPMNCKKMGDNLFGEIQCGIVLSHNDVMVCLCGG